MFQSKLFAPLTKENPKDEPSLNAQLLMRAGFVDKEMAGVYNLLPLGLKVVKKIENIIRQEMIDVGGQELFLPTLHPKKNWEKTGRWDTVDVLFKLKMENGRELGLGPTHEEIITPLLKKHISSYRELPLYLFQFQNKFRNEKRAKSGLLRGREFLMKDLYSFHKNEEDLNEYYEKLKLVYKNIFELCGIGEKTFLTYASGGTFSQFSHEYQTITDAGEDIIHICEKCKVALNEELLEDQDKQCPECGSKDLKKKKVVEVGNIFKLKNKFSDSFGLQYSDKKGEKHPVMMGCYGIGLQRLMGAIVEVFNDKNGIIWPESVAPFQVHLISLLGNRSKKILAKSEEIYNRIKDENIEVLWDDREEVKAGSKFAGADLIGCPWRLVVSEKNLDQDKIEVKKRENEDAKMMSLEEFLKEKVDV